MSWEQFEVAESERLANLEAVKIQKIIADKLRNIDELRANEPNSGANGAGTSGSVNGGGGGGGWDDERYTIKELEDKLDPVQQMKIDELLKNDHKDIKDANKDNKAFEGKFVQTDYMEKLNTVKDKFLGMFSGNYQVDIDFFKEYGLAKYTEKQDPNWTDSSTFLSYIPISIATASFQDSVDNEGNLSNPTENDANEEGTKTSVRIVLPFKPQELRDSVSVSMEKRESNMIESALRQAIGQGADHLSQEWGGGDLGAIFAQFLTITYNASSLKKELTLDFILPLMAAKGKTYDKQWIEKIRLALGSLQGLVYPKSYIALYPPLLKITIGNMYSGFKGYLTNVDLTFSEEQITLADGSLWPLVINGSIKFVNLFNYRWAGDNNVMKDFNLSKNPSVLFGVHNIGTFQAGSTDSKLTMDKLNYLARNDLSLAGGMENFQKKSELFSGIEGMEEVGLNYGNFQDSIVASNFSENAIKGFSNDSDLFSFINKDYPLDNAIAFDVNNLSGPFMKKMNILTGSDGIYDLETLVVTGDVINKVNMVQTIADYANLIKNVKNGNYVGALGTLTQISGGINGALNENLKNTLSTVKIGAGILRTLDISGINLDNIAALYGSAEELLKYIDKIDLSKTSSKEAKDDLTQSLFAFVTRQNVSATLLNGINEDNNNANARYSINPEHAGSLLTTLYNTASQNMSAVVYDSVVENVTVLEKLNEKASELFDNKTINTKVKNDISNMLDIGKKIDISTIKSATDNFRQVFNKLNSLI